MVIGSANIKPEDDIYDPHKRGFDLRWVNGPNRQFEKGLRACHSPQQENDAYQIVYLMESD